MNSPIKIEDHLDRIEKAEKILNYKFNDRKILLKALTHPSAVQGFSLEHSYERYEFLGDALLSAIASFSIFRKYEDMDEGKMTHMRVALVSGESLSRIAEELGFKDLIIFGKSEESTGRRGMKSALENVFEALVAAVFLDGGQIRCWHFVVDTLVSKMINNTGLASKENPKSELQELVQVSHETPTYEIIEETGPAHDRTFVAEVKVEGKVLAQGKGHSKKEAEANAAMNALGKVL